MEYLLPTAIAAVAEYGASCPIIVLDNRSSQGDAAWIKARFPDVEVELAPKNDYLYSYNWLLQKREEEIVVILNNDLRLTPGFLAPLLRHFQAPDVFAVGATSRDWEDTMFTCGPARLKSHHGYYYWDWERDRQTLSHTLFASGGFVAVDRRKFVELGGFNRLYSPAYSEDLDLCFRAWRKGWRTIFEPTSVVFHRENASISESQADRSARLMLRTQLLFQWSSIPPGASRFERCAFFCLTAWRKLLRREFWWLRVWVQTWLEWQRQKRQNRALMTPPDELKRILDAIEKPVVIPSEMSHVESQCHHS